MPEQSQKPTFRSAFRPALYEFIWVGIFGLTIAAITTIYGFLANSAWANTALTVGITLVSVFVLWIILALSYHRKITAKETNPFETPEYDLTPKQSPVEKLKSAEASEHKEVTQTETIQIREQFAAVEMPKEPKLETPEMPQPKPIETKPQEKTVVSKPQTENVELPKINIPEINQAGFQILFRQGAPFIETNEDYRNINLQLENKTGGHLHKVKVKIGTLIESKSYGYKNILLNRTIPYDEGGGGFQISNGGNTLIKIARQSIYDPQRVNLEQFCLNPISTPTFFWSIEFSILVEASCLIMAYPQIEQGIRLSKKFVLYIDEGDLLQLEEI